MTKNQGWQGESKRHSDAAKGKSVSDTGKTTAKGSGWYGDTKGHSKAAKGELKSGGMMGKIKDTL